MSGNSKNKPVCAGVVIRNKNGEYLLVLGRGAHKLSFAKGHIDEGETEKECAIRETYEETGLRIRIPEDTKVCRTKKALYYLLTEDCITGSRRLAPLDRREVVYARWYSPRLLQTLTRERVNSDVWDFIKWVY
jgi:8-oxo-dGTP pyrophosphatase MutT (NUDIX family)